MPFKRHFWHSTFLAVLSQFYAKQPLFAPCITAILSLISHRSVASQWVAGTALIVTEYCITHQRKDICVVCLLLFSASYQFSWEGDNKWWICQFPYQHCQSSYNANSASHSLIHIYGNLYHGNSIGTQQDSSVCFLSVYLHKQHQLGVEWNRETTAVLKEGEMFKCQVQLNILQV